LVGTAANTVDAVIALETLVNTEAAAGVHEAKFAALETVLVVVEVAPSQAKHPAVFPPVNVNATNPVAHV